jgi:hypothetical protein
MPFVPRSRMRSRFILEIYKRTAGDPRAYVVIADVGRALGLTVEQSMVVARQLEALGYIRLMGILEDEHEEASMTEKLLERAEFLTMPRWKRWGSSRVAQMIGSGAVGSAVTLLVAKLFGWILG